MYEVTNEDGKQIFTGDLASCREFCLNKWPSCTLESCDIDRYPPQLVFGYDEEDDSVITVASIAKVDDRIL